MTFRSQIRLASMNFESVKAPWKLQPDEKRFCVPTIRA